MRRVSIGDLFVDWIGFWHDECYVQFFFEPEPCVVGVAEVMREPACLAMVIMKSWTSLRFTLAMLIVSVGFLDGFCCEERIEVWCISGEY